MEIDSTSPSIGDDRAMIKARYEAYGHSDPYVSH